MARTTTITIETSSLMVLRAGGSMRTWCPQCAAEAEMVSLRSFGVISNLDRSAVEEWLNSGHIHRNEAADGSATVCLNSLIDHLTGGNPAERGTARANKETK
jgi:hypothetical protein